MKSVHDAKIEKLNREIAELRAKIIQPVVMPKFDLELCDVLSIVSRVTQVFQEDIISHKRHREIVTARALFSYICRIHLKKPYKYIGRYLNRDHSTIIHLVNNYDTYLQMQYKEETIYYNECIDRVNNAKAKGILTYNSWNWGRGHLLRQKVHKARMGSIFDRHRCKVNYHLFLWIMSYKCKTNCNKEKIFAMLLGMSIFELCKTNKTTHKKQWAIF